MVTSPQIVTPSKTYEVTGELTPDATGTYEDVGEYAGRRYYQRTPNGWFLWWFAPLMWVISNAPGTAESTWWQRWDPNIEGAYEAKGTAIGEATVTEI